MRIDQKSWEAILSVISLQVCLASVFSPVVHDINHSFRSEYQKATSSLGHISDEWAEQQYSRHTDPLMRISEAVMGDVPMV